MIIGTPWKITSREQALRLLKISEKLGGKIDEFLKHGFIEETRQVLCDPRYLALKSFTEVHGIGPSTARDLYDGKNKFGRHFRTLHELRELQSDDFLDNYDFKWHEDLQLPIPRKDVESIANFVKIQLEKTEPGAHVVICGGYRRGKTASNDVDLIITYPHEDGKERGVLKRLLERLLAKGLIPPNGILSQNHSASSRTSTSNKPAADFDSLDKAFVVFAHPPNSTTRDRVFFRRLDLIVTRWDTWGSAVLGWTGSTQFERDLRTRVMTFGSTSAVRHISLAGYKFESGGVRRDNDDQVIAAVTEEDVFRILKVPWMPPELRNADP
ncbi:hypothetical protein P7C70_g5875, partial [Phenoliferia sp. Uapishka_3]